MAAAGFLSHYLSGPLPYVQCHITVNKMCSVHREIKHFLLFIVLINMFVFLHWNVALFCHIDLCPCGSSRFPFSLLTIRMVLNHMSEAI